MIWNYLFFRVLACLPQPCQPSEHQVYVSVTAGVQVSSQGRQSEVAQETHGSERPQGSSGRGYSQSYQTFFYNQGQREGSEGKPV